MNAKRLADEEQPVAGKVIEVGEDMIFIQWEDMNHPTSYKYTEMEGVEIEDAAR